MMRRLFQVVLIVGMLLAVSIAQAGYLQRFERKSLPGINPPQVRVVTLSNGMVCFLLEDHTLPMVQLGVIARTGSIYDPIDRVGLAGLTGMLMRSGGTGNLSAEEFDSAVDDLGANISSDMGAEMGQFALQVLSVDLEQGAKLLFDMVLHPRFDPSRLAVVRLKVEEQLRRENDDPNALVSRHFQQLVYGAQSPWSRRPDQATLKRIDVEDVRAFHQRYFKPNNFLFTAAGNFHSPKLIEMLERMMVGVLPGTVDFAAVPEVILEFKPEMENIERPMTQAFIRVGHLGIRRFNPDRFALSLMSEILGAGFKSRLMEDIRTQRGMAYSIWSNITSGSDYGLFTVGVNTKARQSSEVTSLIRDHIERLAHDGMVTPEEIEFARRSSLSRLIFEFDTASKVVNRRATFRFYGYPDNYWQIFHDQISKVTREDIKKAAQKYLHPEGLKVVVVGPKVN